MHPREDGVTSKTYEVDESLMIDMPWVRSLLSVIKQAPPDKMLFIHLEPSLNQGFLEVAQALHLGHFDPSLCALRHGGESEDLLQQRRTVEQARIRGRWRSANLLKRYVKTTVLMNS